MTKPWVLFTVALVIFSLGCARESSTSAAGGAQIGKLQVVKGSAVVTHGAQKTTFQSGARASVMVGDTVATGPGSEAVVLASKQVHLLGENSQLKFETVATDGSGAGRVSLLEGVSTFLLPPSPVQKPQFEAAANSVVAAVHGTIFQLELKGGDVQVTVVRGEVEVRPDQGAPPVAAKLLKAGERVLARAGKIESAPASADEVGKIRTEVLLKKQILGADLSTF
ncbi:MAG: FecR domain-containing protein [Candidatus Riflebacteria bacterium]|nr:FecR domain-containing protein [Candidatus Riflebacteria bacterium]